MAKLILGLTGPIASGKGTIKKYLVEKYGAKECRFSTPLRDILARLDLEVSRDSLVRLSTSLRQTFGEDTLAKAIAADAAKLDADIVVVDGVRRMADIVYLSKLPGFVLASVDADAKVRYERMKLRNENKGDDAKTFEDFLADHQRETELTIPEVMSHATFAFENSGSMEKLFEQADKVVAKA